MAARFRIGAGTTAWSDTAGWSLTSGGAGGVAVPTASDDVTFDVNSTQDCILDTPTAKAARTLTCTNYTHTLTFNVTLTVTQATGTTTALGGSMSLAGSSALILNGANAGTGTFTPNGLTISIPLTITGNTTWTLGGTATTTALLTLGSAGGTSTVFNSNGFNIGGDFTLSPTSGSLTGTSTITITDTCTITAASSTNGGIRNSFTFNASGKTITLSGTLGLGGTVTYTAGTMSMGSSTLNLLAGATFDTSGMTWANGSGVFSGTVTLSSDLNFSGTLTVGIANNTTTFNGIFNINVANLTIGCTSGAITGTSTIVFNATGTLSDATGTGGAQINLTINTSGTFTLSGTVRYHAGTLKYIAGTISGASTPVLSINGSVTLDFGGATLDASLSCTTAGSIITMKSDLIIPGTRTLTLNGTNASPVQIKSDSTPTLRKLTVQSGITEDVIYCNPTDIDSRDGVPVYYAKGTLSNTFNWIGTNPGQAKKNQIIIGGNTFNAAGFGAQVFGA